MERGRVTGGVRDEREGKKLKKNKQIKKRCEMERERRWIGTVDGRY